MARTSGNQGNCFICGKSAGKTAMKNHIVREHVAGDEKCCLIKAEGAYIKDYWIFFAVPLDAKLSVVDTFLRKIWCECCGHMSEFRAGNFEYSKSQKISDFYIGDQLLYEYDFGSTTSIILTLVGVISRPKQREKICLLARNEPPIFNCDVCGVKATFIDQWEEKFLCDECVEDIDEDECEALLPLTNSPRCGECGYEGIQDRWVFSPNGKFPQIPKTVAVRREVWVPQDEE